MTTTADSAPTHVWTLTAHVFVKVERVLEFQSAFSDVNARCIGISGFLGQGSDSAAPEHGSERWVFNYKYATEQARNACHSQLETAFASMADLMTTSPVVSVDHRDDVRRTVEVVTSQLAPGRKGEYARLRDEMDAIVSKAPGFVSLETFPPSDGGDIWVTNITFSTPENLDLWLSSPERATIREKLAGLAEDDVRTVPTGFGQWFSVNASAMVQTPAWKQAMTVLAVLFPMVSIVNLTIGDAVGTGWTIDGQPIYKGLGLPFPMVVFIGNTIGTILLTWVLMPFVTRLLAWWLDPGATRKRTIQGVVLLLVLYVVEVTIFTTINRTLGI